MLEAALTPRVRRVGSEVLDDPACPPDLRERSITDVTRANLLLGGRRAVLAELRLLLPSLAGLQREVTMLDVGTGLADIPAAARRMASRHGVTLRTIGLDEAASLARASGDRLDAGVCADARVMPFATGSVDVVTCSQVLHHFGAEDAVALLREMDRVARCSVIVSDLRRSWVAAGGFWVLSFPMGFHPVSRADGTLSVLKGFTATELATLVASATGARVSVARRLGWRLTAQWAPRGR